jgi:hypothetical protein
VRLTLGDHHIGEPESTTTPLVTQVMDYDEDVSEDSEKFEDPTPVKR